MNDPVQIGTGASTASGATLAGITNTTLIPAGSTVVLVMSHGGTGVLTSVSSTPSLVWNVDQAVVTGGYLNGVGIAAAYNAGSDIAAGGLSITATLGATTVVKVWQLLYIPGVAPNRLDKGSNDTDNPVTSPSVPALTPTQNGDVLLAAFSINSKLSSDAGWTAGSGWTKCGFSKMVSTNQKTLTVEYRVVSDETAYTPSITLTTADAYAGVGVAYKVGPADTSISPSVATSAPRLIDRIADPIPAGSGAIYGHSHANESTTPQNFSRSLFTDKQAYLGRHVYLHHTLYNFSNYTGLGSDEAWLLQQGCWPIVHIGGRISHGVTDFPGYVKDVIGSGDSGLQAIAAGTYDSVIAGWAAALNGLGSMWARPWNEMNGNWSPWYTTTPAHFIAAWRRMYTIMKAGAPDVALLWCAAFSGSTDHTGMDYYPGDAYVDWVAIDGYRTNPNYYDMSQLFTPFHNVFGPGGTNPVQKPIMVAESSTATDSGTINSHDPVTWLSRAVPAIQALPGIRALCFWEENTHPLTVPEGSASDTEAEYLSIIQDTYLNPTNILIPQVPGASLPSPAAPMTPVITFPATNGTTMTDRIVTVVWGAVTSGGTGPYTYEVSRDAGVTWQSPTGTVSDTASYANGSYTFEVRAVDSLGSHSAAATRTFTVNAPTWPAPGGDGRRTTGGSNGRRKHEVVTPGTREAG